MNVVASPPSPADWGGFGGGLKFRDFCFRDFVIFVGTRCPLESVSRRDADNGLKCITVPENTAENAIKEKEKKKESIELEMNMRNLQSFVIERRLHGGEVLSSYFQIFAFKLLSIFSLHILVLVSLHHILIFESKEI